MAKKHTDGTANTLLCMSVKVLSLGKMEKNLIWGVYSICCMWARLKGAHHIDTHSHSHSHTQSDSLAHWHLSAGRSTDVWRTTRVMASGWLDSGGLRGVQCWGRALWTIANICQYNQRWASIRCAFDAFAAVEAVEVATSPATDA